MIACVMCVAGVALMTPSDGVTRAVQCPACEAGTHSLPRRRRLLDLYCCEGGASRGYVDAGFDVYGVDLFKHKNAAGRTVGYAQKRYPYPSHQGNVLDVMEMLLFGAILPFVAPDGSRVWLGLKDFDAIHASPPCQLYSITNAARKHEYPDLIGPTRELLLQTGLPFVIENVEKAAPWLVAPQMLCGRMFGLSAVDTDGITLVMDRHRMFETNGFTIVVPEHPIHGDEWVGGSYGGARRDKYEAKYERAGGYVPSKPIQQQLLGIDWMTEGGMYQSLPPVYCRHIGEQLMAALDARAVGA